MRREKQAILDRAEIDALIRSCNVCRLGLYDGHEPYVVPLSFGYDGEAFYFHGASQGRKTDCIRLHPRVCFELDDGGSLKRGAVACRFSMNYRSVIGSGDAEILEDLDEKRRALDLIMAQYTDGEFSYPDAAVRGISVIKVSIKEISAKRSKE